MSTDKLGFEQAISNMILASSSHFKDYCYYGYIVAQCNLVFDSDLSAPAAVSFNNTQYDLHINPTHYNNLPLQWRIGILKHECLHILGNHVFRAEVGNYEHLPFNYATDCAINQFIDSSHLPAITAADLANNPNPKNYKVGDPNFITIHNFPSKTSPVPAQLSAEHYYDLLDRKQLPKETLQYTLGGVVDDHGKWAESKGVEDIKDAVTKAMIDEAFNQTTKNRGNLPSQHSQWLELFSNAPEVNWKTVLRRIVGNKRANRKPTLLRKNRRLPEANWLKGTTKQRVFDLLIVSDVSGSVSTTELTETWNEAIAICKVTNTPVTLIQVDSEAHAPEPLKATTRAIERKSHGGTLLAPAIDMAKLHRTPFSVVVITTDGHIDNSDIQAYLDLRVPIIWLITPQGKVQSSMKSSTMTAIQLKGN